MHLNQQRRHERYGEENEAWTAECAIGYGYE